MSLTSALKLEAATSHFINVVTVAGKNQKAQFAKDIIDGYHSADFKKYILSHPQYDGYLLPDYLKMNNAMIEFRHVSKTFSRKGHPVLALQDINLSIDRGDIFGIIGYSGAGKSTLLRLINRLETPGEGEVVLNGEPLQDCSGQRL